MIMIMTVIGFDKKSPVEHHNSKVMTDTHIHTHVSSSQSLIGSSYKPVNLGQGFNQINCITDR